MVLSPFVDFLVIKQYFGDSSLSLKSGTVLNVSGIGCDIETLMFEDGTHKRVFVLEDADEIEYKTDKYFDHVGSYATNIKIRYSDGWLHVSGNPSRLDRLDNVFGYDLETSIKIYNELLRSYGLPSFSSGSFHQRLDKNTGKMITFYDGAHITRIDLCVNSSVGEGNVKKYHKYLASNKFYRDTLGDSVRDSFVKWDFDTVYLTRSKRLNHIAYDKSKEIQERSLPSILKTLSNQLKNGLIDKDIYNESSRDAEQYLNNLSLHCANIGLTRSEIKFLSPYLNEHSLKYYEPDLTWNNLLVRFNAMHEKIFERSKRVIQQEDFYNLTNAEYRAFNQWKEGDDIRAIFTKPTFYRVRASILKKIGIDIAVPPTDEAVKGVFYKPVYFSVKPLAVAQMGSTYRYPDRMTA